MAHWTITGMTGTGKSRIVKEVLIPRARRAGVRTLVLDPVIPPQFARKEWGADYCTDDPGALVAVAKASRKCLIFIDEYGYWMDQGKDAERELQWCFTLARNWGHVSYAMAQRLYGMIPPAVRNQCDQAVVFNQARADLESLAEKLNQPAITDAALFPRGVAYVVRPLEKPVKIRVF